MSRRAGLWMPGLAFAVVAGLWIVAAALNRGQVRGGPVWTAAACLTLQLALSALGLALVDDLRPPRREARSDRVDTLGQALLRAYRGRLLSGPAAFGIATTVTLAATGTVPGVLPDAAINWFPGTYVAEAELVLLIPVLGLAASAGRLLTLRAALSGEIGSAAGVVACLLATGEFVTWPYLVSRWLLVCVVAAAVTAAAAGAAGRRARRG